MEPSEYELQQLSAAKTKRVALGCIHGRFQPFHNGHLEYALAAAAVSEHLLIGISNADPTWRQFEAASPHRHQVAANPWSYFERQTMIRRALIEAGLLERKLTIIPFPIHDLALLPYYVPAAAVHFIRIFSDWEYKKMTWLQQRGWRVRQLQAGIAKSVTGQEVRARLGADGDWSQLVPPAVAEWLRSQSHTYQATSSAVPPDKGQGELI